MAQKKSFVLRIKEETYEALEKWAADEFRSVNGQLEYIIHHTLKEAGRMPKQKSGEKDSTKKDSPDGSE